MSGAKKGSIAHVFPGSTFAFRMRDGRYSVCRVLSSTRVNDVGGGMTPALVMELVDWAGVSIPRMEDVMARPGLEMRAQAEFLGSTWPAVATVGGAPPEDLIWIGDAGEVSAVPQLPGLHECTWEQLKSLAYFEHLFATDRVRHEAEVRAERALTRRAVRRAVLGDRGRGGLEEIHPEALLRHLDADSEHGEPAMFREAVRACIASLRALGPRPPAGRARDVIRSGVEACNALDERLGGFLDSVAVQELVGAFLAMGRATGAKVSLRLIDEWREF